MAKRKCEAGDGGTMAVKKEEIVPEIAVDFRIGNTKRNYCYTLISPGLWKCCKKSDGAPIGQCLFLLKVAERWTAIDAPETSTRLEEVVIDGVSVFSSNIAILEEGRYPT